MQHANTVTLATIPMPLSLAKTTILYFTLDEITSQIKLREMMA